VRFERTLVVLKNYLGDTVMASPLVRTVAAESNVMSVLGSPVTEQIIRFPNFNAGFHDPGNLANVANLFRQAKALRSKKVEAAFLVNRSFRSALLVRLAGIPTRVGHSTEGRAMLLTHRVPYDDDTNEAQSYLDLARAIGLDPEFAVPELWVSDAELATGAKLLQGATVGIQPGARHEYKQIPVGLQRELILRIRELGFRIACFGGNEERRLLEHLPAPDTNLVGTTTIRETIGALANLKLMVGGDTGVMHLAAAVGTPTVTAFGPTPAKKWGWFESPHQVVQAPDGDISKLESGVLTAAVERVLCASS